MKIQLTNNFSIPEFIKSDVAVKNNIDNIPEDNELKNIKNLCKTFLQPFRDWLNKTYKASILISSGYRCYELNRIVLGSPTSAHMKGNAADIYIIIDGSQMSKQSALTLIRKFVDEENPDFDQIIHYEYKNIIHVGIGGKNRREILTNYK